MTIIINNIFIITVNVQSQERSRLNKSTLILYKCKYYNEIGTKVNVHNKVTGLNRCIVK